MKRYIPSTILSALALGLSLSSCVHEFPEDMSYRDVTIKVTHTTEWTYQTWTPPFLAPSRDEALQTRYIYQVSPIGRPEVVVSRTTEYRADLSLADFTTQLNIPAGDWEVWVWNDYVTSQDVPMFWTADNFAAIRLRTNPYQGNDIYKDAFCNHFTVSVPYSDEKDVHVSAEVNLNRPLAAYAIIATDYSEFLTTETTRRGVPTIVSRGPSRFPELEGYEVQIKYSGFIPNQFDLYINNPVDAQTGLGFTSPIGMMNDNEALLGYDYLMLDGDDSMVPLSLTSLDPEGNVVGSTGRFEIPIKRGQCTIVKGEFLTSHANAGIGISTEFDGSFNIEI